MPPGPPVSATFGTVGSGSLGADVTTAGIVTAAAAAVDSVVGAISTTGTGSVGGVTGSAGVLSVTAGAETGGVVGGVGASCANKAVVTAARPIRGRRFIAHHVETNLGGMRAENVVALGSRRRLRCAPLGN